MLSRIGRWRFSRTLSPSCRCFGAREEGGGWEKNKYIGLGGGGEGRDGVHLH